MKIASSEIGTITQPRRKVKNPTSNQPSAQKQHQMIQKIRSVLGPCGSRITRSTPPVQVVPATAGLETGYETPPLPRARVASVC